MMSGDRSLVRIAIELEQRSLSRPLRAMELIPRRLLHHSSRLVRKPFGRSNRRSLEMMVLLAGVTRVWKFDVKLRAKQQMK